jgi:outer membrane protein OmpA-like peptidoglycan-associated protein/tetratricopeptide (TPR) repeat protein
MIKKHLIFLVVILFVSSIVNSQLRYSTSNKKAIKLFEQAQQVPNLTIDPYMRGPNFSEGLKLLSKALEKDPNFWEAHLLAAQYEEYKRNFSSAVDHYEWALRINPHHSATGSTYYYLANSLMKIGEYSKALKAISIYQQQRNPNQDFINATYAMRASCEFAIESKKNPKKFNPLNIGPGINTKDPEYFPTITVDGKTILFTRRIVDSRVPGIQQQEDFYVSQYIDGVWQKAEAMPENINTVLNEGAPTIAADGRSLIFVACADQTGTNNYGSNRTGKGSCDLFYTKKIGSNWLNPKNVAGSVNTINWESQPSLSADGKTLYFIRRVSQKGDLPNTDIFVTTLQENGTWSAATPLPNTINTPMQEESVLIHPDGKTLYFASKGHIGMGGSDIFVTRLQENGQWSKPENLGFPINTEFDENSLLVSPEGDIAFFASDRSGGYGGLDIYYFELPEEFKPTRTLYFDGIVFDALTKKPLGGKFQLIDVSSGKEIILSEADKITGEFMVTLPLNREYALNVTYPGYTFFSQNFNMTNPDNLTSVHMDVPMIPLSSDEPVRLDNIFFDLNSALLRPSSYPELNKLVEFMTSNPTIRIEIGGHTDTRGDAKENMTLSTNRAKAVYSYLIEKGIDPNRVEAKGYGESKPVVTDEKLVQLPNEIAIEKAHQLNRRTEYRILK